MEQLKWETKKVKVKDLIQLDINPRKISEDKKQKLVGSLEKFNLVEIPAVNTDLQIIGGNQRVTALLLVGRGEEEIDVRFPNRKLTKKEVKEYAIISNTHAGEFDFEILDLEFADISIGELGFEIEGWDDWKNKQDTLLAGEAQEDDFDVPEGGIETDIVLGDLFEIGEHRLLCGDSTEADAVGKLLNGKEPYLMVTDPPYGIEYKPEWRSQAMPEKNDANHGRSIGKVMNDDKADWTEAWALSPAKVAYVYHDPKNSGVVLKSLTDCAFEIRSQIIWYKSHFAISRCDYHPMHEPLWYAVKKGNKGNWASDRKQTTVWEINKNQKNETGHSTQKPIECMSKPIGNHDGDVYDPFLGSGTTMVAAHQLKRKCYGMELDSKYCEVIVTRMIKLDNTLTIKRNGVDETKKWLEKIA